MAESSCEKKRQRPGLGNDSIKGFPYCLVQAGKTVAACTALASGAIAEQAGSCKGL